MNKIILMTYKSFLLILILALFSCSRSARKRKHQNSSSSEQVYKKNERTGTTKSSNRNIIQMKKSSGVYHIPVTLNGMEMDYIFDTGASMITMSKSDYFRLKNAGKISESDIKNKQDFTDANGDVSTGVIVNIKKVKVGKYILDNVKAAVISGESAPRLFGQSALSRFGKVSVDYAKNQIIIE